MDEMLKAESAMELPHMQGIAEALGTDSSLTTGQFCDAVDETLLKNAMSRRTGKTAYSSDNSRYADACNEITDFVQNIEDEYIGKTYPAAVILRANFDAEGTFINLQTQNFWGEYTDDLSMIIPSKSSEMKERGRAQVFDVCEKYLETAEIR